VKVKLSADGALKVPVKLRKRDGLLPGQAFSVGRVRQGEYRLVALTRCANDGLVDWLLSCPEKGYFVPVESEPTDQS
jgi:hypothetical protein